MKPGALENRLFHELLAEIADTTTRALKDSGIAEDVARNAGVVVADSVVNAFGGSTIYIPINGVERTAQRDAEIAQAVAESDPATVGLAYGVTTRTIYRACKRAEARARRDREKGTCRSN